MSGQTEIKVNFDADKIQKLRLILDDLLESKAIETPDIEDFIRFTVFIVFDEYDKSPDSLRKFYQINLSNYLKWKKAEEN
jgi:hypothetical protein